jgi:hypothetical protein
MKTNTSGKIFVRIAVLVALSAGIPCDAETVAQWSFDGLKPGEPVSLVKGTGAAAFDLAQKLKHRCPVAVALPGADEVPAALRGRVVARFLDDDAKGSDFLEASAPQPGLDFAAGTPFTIEAWVMLKSLPKEKGWQRAIFSTRSQSPGNPGIVLSVSPEGNVFFTIDEGAPPPRNLKSEAVIPTGVWLHVAAVRDERGRVTLFVNGKKDAAPPVLARYGVKTDAPPMIGSTAYAGSRSRWDGDIAAVRISDAALAPEQFLHQ